MKDLWFCQPDTFSLCRNGGNGPSHPSQLYAVRKYVKPGMSFLDFGCGSATTFEALKKAGFITNNIIDGIFYMGVDIIPKNIEWCKGKFTDGHFQVNDSVNKIDQPDKSWDVVYSRHVVDHMESFEGALDEHCRVAKKLVIIVLWQPFTDANTHNIQNITENGKIYKDEYINTYSRSLVLKAIKAKTDWKLIELKEEIINDSKAGTAAPKDICIVLGYG